MDGLRMFIRPDSSDSVEPQIFYSRRSDGPIYRWHFEKQLARWQAARVDTSDWSSHELSTFPWQSIPHELKDQLSEHYVE